MSGKERTTNAAPPARADAPDGEWVNPTVSYVDPERRFCSYCGRPIARRYWRLWRDGAEAIYCGPAHAAQHNISLKNS